MLRTKKEITALITEIESKLETLRNIKTLTEENIEALSKREDELWIELGRAVFSEQSGYPSQE